MEAIKLQSMTDFIESKKPIHAYLQNESFSAIQTHINETYDLFFKYCDFLKQPLQLGFFVPCDEDGNLWEFPPTNEEWEWAQKDSADAEQSYKMKQFYYEKAKERILFKGFHSIGENEIELLNSDNWMSFSQKTIKFTDEFGHEIEVYRIEDLIELNLELTDSAIKQIGI